MLTVIGAVLLLAGLILLWWQGVPALYRTAGSGEDARLRAATHNPALLAGFVGLGALGTFWLNSRVYRITARTFELTEQGQLTDRYTKAIEQLGDDKLDVRLGGIYALERIAVDSERDHPTVVEVISAYARERTAPIQRVRPANRRTAHPRSLRKEVKLGADAEAVLTVLGRLPSRTGVRRGDLSGANLTGAHFFRANLTGAFLDGADLTGTHFGGANLTRAYLGLANLTRAFLGGADLTGAFLDGVNLTGAPPRRGELR